MKLLKDIVQILSGIYVKPGVGGTIFYLQARHFLADGTLDIHYQPDLYLDAKIHNHLLINGDLLLSSRGENNFAAIYEESEVGPAVASSSFLVLRIRDWNKITPGYLSWFLNSQSTQIKLKNLSKGSNIQSITKASLELFEVPVPTLEVQKNIFWLSLQQKALTKIKADLLAKENQYIEQKILNLITEQK